MLCFSRLSFADGQDLAHGMPTVEEVYQHFFDANGGRENIRSIETMVLRGSMTDGNSASWDLKLYRKRPNKLRMQLRNAAVQIDSIFNGEQGWQVSIDRDGNQCVSALQGDQLEGIFDMSEFHTPFYLLYSYRDRLKAEQFEEVNGVVTIRIDVAPEVPLPFASIWISTENWQEVKLLKRSLNGVETGEAASDVILISDHDVVGGVYVARRIENVVGGELRGVITVNDVRINAGIFDSYFRYYE